MTVQELIDELQEIVEARPDLADVQVIDREGSVIGFTYHDADGLHVEPSPFGDAPSD